MLHLRNHVVQGRGGVVAAAAMPSGDGLWALHWYGAVSTVGDAISYGNVHRDTVRRTMDNVPFYLPIVQIQQNLCLHYDTKFSLLILHLDDRAPESGS